MSSSGSGAREINNPGSSSTFPKDRGKYSLHINIGWTFANDSKNLPSGQYTLRINGQIVHDGKGNRFSNGKIIINRALKSLNGSGELIIRLADDSLYKAKVILGNLKPIQTPEGLASRLTNLGFYAGDGKANNRLGWAIRAFKRIKMNSFTYNKVEIENNEVTPKFLKKIQDTCCDGKSFPGDDITKKVMITTDTKQVPYCGMFGTRVYHHGEKDNFQDNNHKSNNKVEPIAGDFPLYLRAFAPEDKNFKCRGPFSNRINLPQPIHMAQFVLFELGYWLVADEAKYTSNWVKIDDTWTRNEYHPNGEYGTYTQWAMQGFQRYAKMGLATKEDITSKEERYLSRLELSHELPEVTGDARYPVSEELDGVLSQVTKEALQAWADEALRCPVVIFPSAENNTTGSFDSDFKSKEREYNQEQIDRYYQYVTPDSNVWTDIWHGAYAVGEIISGGISVAGGLTMATVGVETIVAVPFGIVTTIHGIDTFSSGCNDLMAVFSENRIGFGYGNLNMLKTCYQKKFGKEWGSIVYSGIDIYMGFGGVKAAFKAMRTGVKTTEQTGYIIKYVYPKVKGLIQDSFKTTVVLGVGERVVEGYIVIRDGTIILSNTNGVLEDITNLFK